MLLRNVAEFARPRFQFLIAGHFYFLSPLFVGLVFKLGIAVTKSVACGFASNEQEKTMQKKYTLYEILAQPHSSNENGWRFNGALSESLEMHRNSVSVY